MFLETWFEVCQKTIFHCVRHIFYHPLAQLSLLIAVCCLRQAPRSRQVGGLVLLLLDQVGGLVLLVALPLEHKQHPLLPGAALPPTQGLEYLLAAQILPSHSAAYLLASVQIGALPPTLSQPSNSNLVHDNTHNPEQARLVSISDIPLRKSHAPILVLCRSTGKCQHLCQC